MSRSAVSLSDRFVKREGRILITGVQALVRLMLVQADRDRAAGLKTGGFVSGYRGSPLGTLDLAFAPAKALTDERNIVVKPAVNEELAATAVAGSQQIDQTPGARVDGVFALWYGKGPGLDRAADAIRHGNYQGASAHGGVVLAVGDDHLAKSSSIVCYSDETIASIQIPLLYPADAGEIVTYGLHGFAMSRLTGSWAALKIITEVADASRAVDTNELTTQIVFPEVERPPAGLHNRWPETPLEQELRQQEFRLPAIHTYVRANCLDRAVGKGPRARVGIVAAGKSWLDLQEGLHLLGLDSARLEALGIAFYKPAMIWPLEPLGLAEFSRGLETLVVVEEKAAFLENQIKTILYGMTDRPAIWGKAGPTGAKLFPSIADLNPEQIAAALGSLLAQALHDESLAEAATHARAALADQAQFVVPPTIRRPFFCSGCPHNRSTVVPEGSRAAAGIGCHGLAAYNRPRTATFSQMGGEGVHWMGLAPFTDEAHIFANMGDGTYFHSGILAIRQAVAANVNITFKLLYNSAVAMTGGQPVDGEMSIPQLVDQLRAEGAKKIIISTDDPQRYRVGDLAGVKADRVEHRDEFEALQLEIRETPGVTVIIYEQMCATEKRRQRKRGKLAEPDKRVFINELVCEGCGDCSVKSNCLSVEPIHTEFGVKRRINQSSCNKDFSCLAGFCPSFVTVEGGVLRKASGSERLRSLPPLPDAVVAAPSGHQRLMVAGIGGTGVVTIGALLSMSGHLRGRKVAVLDQVGMAQKGGAVTSHIHLAQEDIHALRIPVRQADLVLACDQIVANSRDVIGAIAPGHTQVIVNADVSITGDFTQDRNAIADGRLLTRRLLQRTGEGYLTTHPFSRLAERLLGDAIGSNLMMVGLAYQKGWIGIDLDAMMEAIDLNGAAVAMNKAAFEIGRHLACNASAVYAVAQLAPPRSETLDEIIAKRANFLTAYQNSAYAARFLRAITAVRNAERLVSADTALTEAASRSLFKLMAYKDEYEVARLYTDGSFAKSLADQFDGKTKLTFHMAPPILATRDKVSGHLRKRTFGPWMLPLFRVLSRFKGLRGTPFDPFGYSVERRMERALITEYEQLLAELVDGLKATNLQQAVKIARTPMEIRGYGHVKTVAVEEYRRALAAARETPPRSVELARVG